MKIKAQKDSKVLNAPRDQIRHGSFRNASIIACGEDLVAFSKFADIADAKIVSVVDIGSNSVKIRTYDCTQPTSDEIKAGEYDLMCGLANGMAPNDPNPQLSEAGLKKYYTEALPGCLAAIKRVKPDTIIILCTEAVRAANGNPNQKNVIDQFKAETAKQLGVHIDTINIISPEMEARLAAEGVLFAHNDADGYSDTTGGGSRELAAFAFGRIIKSCLTTLRLGTKTLSPLPNKQEVIEDAFNEAPLFTSEAITAKDGSKLKENTEGKILFLQSGAFRIVARILAQRIHFIDFKSQIPFYGHSFRNNDRFISELISLKTATRIKLHDEFLRFEYRSQKTIRKRSAIKIHDFQKWKLEWQKTEDYTEWKNKFEKRIGQRLEMLAASIEIALADIRRVKPRQVTFSIHSIREGVLRYAGVGRNNHIKPGPVEQRPSSPSHSAPTPPASIPGQGCRTDHGATP